MRRAVISVLVLVAAATTLGVIGAAQRGQAPPSPIPTFQVAADKLYPLDEGLLHWPLAAADTAYAAIDGKRLHQYVEDQTAISRRYRDAGHPQFWGRVIGTTADDESQQWWLGKFKQFGLSDVHLQTFDMVPQWMPQSWSVTGTAEHLGIPLSTLKYKMSKLDVRQLAKRIRGA